MALWLLGWAAWKGKWLFPVNFYATAFVLLMVVDTFQTRAAAHHIAGHRRDGMFELLLTTPLQPAQIVAGQVHGLAAQFRPLRNALSVALIAMMLGGLFTRPWSRRALITYFLIWAVLITWVATNRRYSLPTTMWIALNCGRPAFALIRMRGAAWVWAVQIFNIGNFIQGIGTARQSLFPTGSLAEMIVVCIAAVFAAILIGVARRSKPELRDRLISEMRSIAQEPVPSPKDPRFKKWNIKERFPANRS